jgi:hypothetical protein
MNLVEKFAMKRLQSNLDKTIMPMQARHPLVYFWTLENRVTF